MSQLIKVEKLSMLLTETSTFQQDQCNVVQ